MAGWIETFRGVVFPYQCDHQGHMNVMHYMGMFDQGGWHMMHACGVGAGAIAAGRGFVSAKDTIEYLIELHAGALVVIRGGVGRIGTTSVTLVQRMVNVESGALVARCETIAVHFDLVARTKLPIPDDIRARLNQHLVDPSRD